MDYARLYNLLHLGFLRPLLLNTLVLIFFILKFTDWNSVKCKQIKYLWLFVFLLSIYIPFAMNNSFAYRAFKTQVLYMPFILSTMICINSIQRLRNFILICICIEIYISIYAINHNGLGPGNYFGDENDLALYINMWLPFCFILYFSDKNKIHRVIYIVGLASGLIAIIVSFSRGGFVGLIAVAFTLWSFFNKKILTLVLLSSILFLMLVIGADKYWEEMSTITNTKEETANTRLLSWEAGWKMFLDNPLGVGGYNFQVRFPEYQSKEFTRNMWGRAAHSLWFTLFPELGILGIYIYFVLLYYNIKDILFIKKIEIEDSNDDMQYLNHLSVAFLASLAGYFASGTFLSVLYYAHYWYMTGIIVAANKVTKKYVDLMRYE